MPLAVANLASEGLSKKELQQKWSDLEELVELHAQDPVAGLDLWKAICPSQVSSPERYNNEHSNSGTLSQSLRRTLPRPRGAPGSSAAEEMKYRLRRAGRYPESLILLIDPSINERSNAEIEQYTQRVKEDQRRLETEIKRWRAALDGAKELESKSVQQRNLHELEEELLEAKLEEMQIHLAETKSAQVTQQRKLDVVSRHVSGLLGDSLHAELSPHATATDLSERVKKCRNDIRDLRQHLERKRVEHSRTLDRARNRAALLEAELEAKKCKALDDVRKLHPTDADVQKFLQNQRDGRLAKLLHKAVEQLVSTEAEQRLAIVNMASAAASVIKSDFQVVLLSHRVSLTSSVGAPIFAIPVSSTPIRTKKRR